MLSERFFDFFVVAVITLIGGGLVVSAYTDTYGEDRECRARHGTSSYIEEAPVGVTDGGCRITRISRYAPGCLFISQVYVTECPCSITTGDGSKKRAEGDFFLDMYLR